MAAPAMAPPFICGVDILVCRFWRLSSRQFNAAKGRYSQKRRALTGKTVALPDGDTRLNITTFGAVGRSYIEQTEKEVAI